MKCKATTKAGNPCQRTATVDDFCVAHTTNPEKSITKHLVPGPHPGGGRPRRPREIELLQRVADEKVAELKAVYSDGLVADKSLVVGNGPSAHLELVPDHPHRHRVAESIIDRLHGKPTPAGADAQAGALVNINLIADPNVRESFADIRARLGSSRAIQSRRTDARDGTTLDLPSPPEAA